MVPKRSVEDPTAKAERVWDAAAPRYDRAMRLWEKIWFAGGREWIGARVSGRMVEVAIGTGRNLEYYPAGVSVTGVDLSTAMLAQARQRAAQLGRDVDLRHGDAQALPLAHDSFDTVVCALSLCAIPDPQVAIAEMRRVLRPGGTLLLLDHVVSTWWPIRIGQRFLEWFSIRAAGEHLTRRPLPLVEAAGFEIVETQRLKAGTVERVAARKPQGG